jgi:uracil-DNA glycosylase family 4
VSRGVYGGNGLRRLLSKPQKFASVKGEEGIRALPLQEKQDTLLAAPTPGRGYPKAMKALITLQQQILRCTHCPRLVEYRARVAREKRRQYREWDYWGKPLPGFGDPQARLLIIGLAPAAHGGNRTGRMFTGDQSGDWVYGTLHRFGFANQSTSQHRDDGLTLHDAYITAAARCVPPDNKPSGAELAACRPYLVRELQLLRRVRIVVPLGKIAFDAYLAARRELDLPLPNQRPQFGHGVSAWLPEGVLLLASYHPSRQNTQTGRLTQAMFDAIFAQARHELNAESASLRPGRGKFASPLPPQA